MLNHGTIFRALFSSITAACLPGALCRAQIIVNEFMYAPASAEPEWIELFNAGTSAIDLSEWTLNDAGGSKAALPSAIVPPKGYVVLTRDTAKLRDVRAIPSRLLQLPLPGLNNDGDIIALRDRNGMTVDSLRFDESWGGADGVSLERRSPSHPSVQDTSWSESIGPTKATPGRKNSITPAEINLTIDAALFTPNPATVSLTVRNTATTTVSGAHIVIHYDPDSDGTGDQEINRMSLPDMPPGATEYATIAWPRTVTIDGEEGVAEVVAPGDEVDADDILSFTARAPVDDAPLVITEIMFDPADVNGATTAEYLELYNPSPYGVSLTGWRIYDGTGKSQGTVRTASTAAPGQYVVIASDTTIRLRFPNLRDSANVIIMGRSSFGLNTSSDDVKIVDRSGRTIDSISYDDSWHWDEIADTKGISLERISLTASSNDARNWSSSLAPAGGTPAAPNSRALPILLNHADLVVAPETLSPDGDGFEDFVRISYRLPVETSRITLSVYDRHGRFVKRIANNEPSAAEGELIWDGYDDRGEPLAPGIYVVRLEAYDQGGAGLIATQGAVIIARKL